MPYRSTIQNFMFELEEGSNRISVYRDGNTLDPHALIHVTLPIEERDFHLEIMDWFSKKTNQ